MVGVSLGEAWGEPLGSAPGRSWTLSALCIPLTSSLSVRAKNCLAAEVPHSLFELSPSILLSTKGCETGVTLMVQINLKLKSGPRGLGPGILLCGSPGFNGFVAL